VGMAGSDRRFADSCWMADFENVQHMEVTVWL